MSNIGISPDQISQQKQMLEGAAQMAHQRDGVKLNYEGRKQGSKRQLITTIVVVVAITAVLVLQSVLGNR